MHSAHHTRGRIIFEVFCALALAGSLAGAWAQTDASALLSAAAIAALYGVWHLADLRRPAQVSDAAPAVPGDEDQGELLAYQPASEQPAADAPEAAESPAEAVVEPSAKRGRKPPRQRAGRAKQEAQPTIAEIADKLDREFAAIAQESAMPDPEPEPQPEAPAADSAGDAPEYVPATPLFEPEPFVRQQRAAFGRKARP